MQFEDNLGMRLRRAYLALHRRANATFRPYGVTADQFVALTLLAERDDVSQRQLGDRSFADSSTVGSMVTLMEKKGWVERRPCPDDGRAWRIHLTARGRELQRELWEASSDLHRELWATPRSTSEEEALYELLDRVTEAMSEAAVEVVAGSGVK